MHIDDIRASILSALARGEQPSYTDITALVQADPVLAAVVEVAVKMVVSQARQARTRALANRFRLTATAA